MAWIYVKGAIETSGSGTVATISFSTAATVGSVICGFVFNNNVSTSDTITSIVDDLSNSYTKVNNVGITGASGTWNTVAFWSGGAVGNSPTTITITNSAAQGSVWIVVDAFTPPSGTLSLDGNNTGSSGGATNPTATAFTTGTAGDLIYGGTFTTGGAPTAGSGYTLTESAADIGAEYQNQVSAGSTTVSFTAAFGQYSVNGFAIKAVASATTPFGGWFFEPPEPMAVQAIGY